MCLHAVNYTRGLGKHKPPDLPQSAQITAYRLAELFVILGVSPNCHGEDLNKRETWIIQISSCLFPSLICIQKQGYGQSLLETDSTAFLILLGTNVQTPPIRRARRTHSPQETVERKEGRKEGREKVRES